MNANHSNPDAGTEMPQQPLGMFQRLNPKRLEDVTCYKCGTKGHYANRCPKGHLAFLSARMGKGEKNEEPPKVPF